MSGVRCQVSHFFFYKGVVSWGRVCYQQCLPLLVLNAAAPKQLKLLRFVVTILPPFLSISKNPSDLGKATFSLRLWIQCCKQLHPDLSHACMTERFGPHMQLVSHTCAWCCTPATGVAHWCCTLARSNGVSRCSLTS